MELCSVVIFGWNNNQTVGHTNYDGRPVVLNHLKIQKRSHHAGVDCSLLNITSNASHKCIPIFKVGIKIGLEKKGEISEDSKIH